MGEKWPKIGHIPRHFSGSRCSFPAGFHSSDPCSVRRCFGMGSRGYMFARHIFPCLPRSKAGNHRTWMRFLSYSPLLRTNNLHIAQVPVERHTSQRPWVRNTIAIHHKWLPTSLNGAPREHCAINSAGLRATVEESPQQSVPLVCGAGSCGVRPVIDVNRRPSHGNGSDSRRVQRGHQPRAIKIAPLRSSDGGVVDNDFADKRRAIR